MREQHALMDRAGGDAPAAGGGASILGQPNGPTLGAVLVPPVAPSTTAAPQASSLADLPSAWLAQMVLLLDGRSRQHLFAASHATALLVVTHAPARKLRVTPQPVDARARAEALHAEARAAAAAAGGAGARSSARRTTAGPPPRPPAPSILDYLPHLAERDGAGGHSGRWAGEDGLRGVGEEGGRPREVPCCCPAWLHRLLCGVGPPSTWLVPGRGKHSRQQQRAQLSKHGAEGAAGEARRRQRRQLAALVDRWRPEDLALCMLQRGSPIPCAFPPPQVWAWVTRLELSALQLSAPLLLALRLHDDASCWPALRQLVAHDCTCPDPPLPTTPLPPLLPPRGERSPPALPPLTPPAAPAHPTGHNGSASAAAATATCAPLGCFGGGAAPVGGDQPSRADHPREDGVAKGAESGGGEGGTGSEMQGAARQLRPIPGLRFLRVSRPFFPVKGMELLLPLASGPRVEELEVEADPGATLAAVQSLRHLTQVHVRSVCGDAVLQAMLHHPALQHVTLDTLQLRQDHTLSVAPLVSTPTTVQLRQDHTVLPPLVDPFPATAPPRPDHTLPPPPSQPPAALPRQHPHQPADSAAPSQDAGTRSNSSSSSGSSGSDAAGAGGVDGGGGSAGGKEEPEEVVASRWRTLTLVRCTPADLVLLPLARVDAVVVRGSLRLDLDRMDATLRGLALLLQRRQQCCGDSVPAMQAHVRGSAAGPGWVRVEHASLVSQHGTAAAHTSTWRLPPGARFFSLCCVGGEHRAQHPPPAAPSPAASTTHRGGISRSRSGGGGGSRRRSSAGHAGRQADSGGGGGAPSGGGGAAARAARAAAEAWEQRAAQCLGDALVLVLAAGGGGGGGGVSTVGGAALGSVRVASAAPPGIGVLALVSVDPAPWMLAPLGGALRQAHGAVHPEAGGVETLCVFAFGACSAGNEAFWAGLLRAAAGGTGVRHVKLRFQVRTGSERLLRLALEGAAAWAAPGWPGLEHDVTVTCMDRMPDAHAEVQLRRACPPRVALEFASQWS